MLHIEPQIIGKYSRKDADNTVNSESHGNAQHIQNINWQYKLTPSCPFRCSSAAQASTGLASYPPDVTG